MAAGRPVREDNHDHPSAKMAHCDHTRLAIVPAIVGEPYGSLCEHLGRVGKIEATLPQGPGSFLRVERDVHAGLCNSKNLPVNRL